MSERDGIAARIEEMARGVFGLADENEKRLAACADEAAEMMRTLSSASFEKTQEPFAPPAAAPSEEER